MPTVYFYGDSWTYGTAAAEGQGFPHVVGQALGWTIQVGPDGSAAGYTNTFWKPHPAFPVAVQRLPRLQADLIVLEGGLNDEIAAPDGRTVVADGTNYATAVTKTVEALRDRSGGAPIVLVGPAPPTGSASPALQTIDRLLRTAATRSGAPYVSPIGERWLTPQNVGHLIDPATKHPSTTGHAYYGGRLASALARLTTSRGTAEANG